MFGFKKSTEKKIVNETDSSMQPENTSAELKSDSLRNILSKSYDVKFRNMLINDNKQLPVTLIYIEGLTNASFISDYILKPLVQEPRFKQVQDENEAIQLIENGDIYFSSQFVTKDINKVLSEILSGGTALIFDECSTAIIFDTKSFEKRSITEPTVENVTKSSKDTFVETFNVNTATVRRKIKTQNLIIENTIVGKQTLTSIGIVYINGIANTKLIDEVKKKLNAINVDNVISTGFIEEYLSDNINSVFPQLFGTERVGKFCAEIVEGRVGIIIDGLPIAFIVPGTLVQFMQAPEDYSHNYIIASVIRFMRFAVMFLVLLLPGFYVSITNFHAEMIPTRLALAIARTRAGVAFPSLVETLLLLVSFELLFEANLRIPKTIGQAVSIIGTIVIGQAAVDAKLVSAPLVVIIAVTSIAAFAMPNQDLSNALRLWRMFFTIAGGILGLLGLVIVLIIFTFHLCRLESFGVPYLSPFVSEDGNKQLVDTLFRFPLKYHKNRPINLNVKNKKRRGN